MSDSHAHLVRQARRHSPPLLALLEAHGPLELERETGSLRTFLARCIIGQQLSNRAAATIIGRVEARAPIDGEAFWQRLRLGDDAALAESGVSRSKRRAIAGLADGLDEAHARTLADPDAVRAHLTGFWGIGAWTAEMACLFHYRFADVWSPGDASLSRGIGLLADGDGTALVDACRPYRSHLALHIWKGLDEGRLRPRDGG